MAIDRDDTLRKAEKLLRQGRLEGAIAEYARVVEAYPKDWTTANALGDLYVRAGQPARAAEQYLRIADHFFVEGFTPKAIALYKKILKIKPDDEPTQLQLAEASVRQGLLADAKMYLGGVIERRRQRGDARGANEVLVRLGAIDPNDLDARLSASRAMVALGDTPGAVLRLRQLAEDLQDRARDSDALDVLREIVRLDPSDVGARARLARTSLETGDIESARAYLTREVAGDDPAMMLALAEVELRGGDIAQGGQLVRELLARDPNRRDAVMELGLSLCDGSEESAFTCIDAVTDGDVAAGDWAAASAALQELVSRRATHVPALMKLVEVCVDGGFEEATYTAQAQLADAYLAAGRGAEARVISEDLVAREPWEKVHIERFRQALLMLGETDPDAIVAERLSGQTPFLSTDQFAPSPPPAPPAPAAEPAPAGRAAAPPGSAAPRKEEEGEGLDVAALLRETEAAEMAQQSEPLEVDLTTVLTGMEPPAPAAVPAPAASLDDVFRDLRDEVGRQAAEEAAARQWKLAQTYLEMGMAAEAIDALKGAARSPRHRFQAAAALGRFYRQRGEIGPAVEWLERAAEAPSATPADSHDLLYDLADTLEQAGEIARALAVFLELAAETGAFRDVERRIEHLSRVQAGG